MSENHSIKITSEISTKDRERKKRSFGKQQILYVCMQFKLHSSPWSIICFGFHICRMYVVLCRTVPIILTARGGGQVVSNNEDEATNSIDYWLLHFLLDTI